MLSQKITNFLFNLQLPTQPPAGIETLFPFADEATKQACTTFYNKFYNDDNPRYCIIGINPGRLAAV